MISWNVLQRTSTNDIVRTSILQRGWASAGVVGSTKACKAAIVWTYDVLSDPKKSHQKKTHRVWSSDAWATIPAFQNKTFVSHHFREVVPLLFRVIANHLTFACSAARTSWECLLKVTLVVERSKVCCSERTIVCKPAQRAVAKHCRSGQWRLHWGHAERLLLQDASGHVRQPPNKSDQCELAAKGPRPFVNFKL